MSQASASAPPHLCTAAIAVWTILALALPAVAQYPSASPIKVGQTAPFSGPASAYSTVARAQAAYFKMINDEGGIHGHPIELIQYDDGYNPAKTVEQVRRLVEGDEVQLLFQLVGTSANAAVEKYLNDRNIPQLLIGSGAERFNDPTHFSWTMPFNPSYFFEGRIYARYILNNFPQAHVGILYQNDDLGREYLRGVTSGLGNRASEMITKAISYDTDAPTIDSQIVTLKALGVTVLVDAATAKFAAQSIRKMAELGWRPVHLLNINSTSIGGVLGPAGLENAKDILSVNYGKDPLDPSWRGDPGMARYLDFMSRYYPAGDPNSNLNSYAYGTAQLLVEILRRCGEDFSGKNVMRQATHLNEVELDLSLPGVSVNTSPDDYRVVRVLQMMRFSGERWEVFGPLLTDTGP